MLLVNSAGLIRVVTSAAAQIEVHASVVDIATSTGVVTVQDPINTPHITTATTTTVVSAPASGSVRNVKHLNITNDHATQSCVVTVEHSDGTTTIELMAFTLLPGENMIFNEEGRWTHRDAQGAEYPASGLGAYNGYAVPFFKAGTAPEGAGYWYCSSKDGGFAGAWSPGSPGVNGRVTDGTASADFGCVPIPNPSTGTNYLTNALIAATNQTTNMFFDCLWVNTGLSVTTTTAQAITTPTLPARDVNGTTNGEGCIIGILCTAAVGLAANASNATVSYTNSDGTSGRTATLVAIAGSQAPISPVIGTMIWFNLQAGDKGVRSIQSLTLGTTWVSGTISMIIARPIFYSGVTLANAQPALEFDKPGIKLPNNVCLLHCALATGTNASVYAGNLVIQEK